jgi:hypothetical protein
MGNPDNTYRNRVAEEMKKKEAALKKKHEEAAGIVNEVGSTKEGIEVLKALYYFCDIDTLSR